MSRKKRPNKPSKKQRRHSRINKKAKLISKAESNLTTRPLSLLQQLKQYALLMRLNRPIGILLLLWPTYWALWLAAEGIPSIKNVVIFTLGCIVMRSAGCVINDYADRHIDGHVERTRNRPIVSGNIKPKSALMLFTILCLFALALVLFTNQLTILLSGVALLLACCYPFSKRHTQMPQVVLGAAFAWSVPMAFAAERGELTTDIGLVYLCVLLWTIVYDTFYAMVDRNDDIKIGVKSTAILFGEADRVITATLQAMVIFSLFLIGKNFELGQFYFISLFFTAGLFSYQQFLIKDRERDACFKAFINNHWVGFIVFVGITAHYAMQ